MKYAFKLCAYCEVECLHYGVNYANSCATHEPIPRLSSGQINWKKVGL